MSVKSIFTVAIASIILLGFIGYGLRDAVNTNDKLEFQDVQLNSKSIEIKTLQLKQEKLNVDLENAAKDKNLTQEQYDKLNKENQELERQKQDLESQLQSKLDQKNKLALASAKAINALTATQTVHASSSGRAIDCKNQTTAKAFIYCHESGNNPAATNSGGCRGLGQACPGSKLPCSDNDYACQDAWFTNYMQNRYGSWEAAKAHWLARVPINGVDRGSWW